MDIQYLNILLKYPEIDGDTNKGMPESDIILLEQTYNKGNSFPKVLKELLFLAGNYCYALDYGIYDSQNEMQREERLELLDVYNLLISRSLFFICLASHGLPVFMFLDEGDNPPLNQLANNPVPEKYFNSVNGTLPMLIEGRIRNHIKGFNMF
ncbi:hypothetical protein [Chryseobacterium shigense]|uniref:Uncharacterized protein n=1 Tax=Chryseobacterium shigense TaxID=297244 RepID=A0A841NDI6_9FLAO|nr:hypothetical protein [Chryseobacterium shigense]MBB6369409.1 hypothetical protein [Chryseobacterium shigense]